VVRAPSSSRSWVQASRSAVSLFGMREDPGRDAVAAEREALLFFLDRVRDAVVRASEGLTEDQQRTPGVPSGTNLLGLIRHLTAMEAHWFEGVFLGDTSDRDSSMDAPPTMSHDMVVAAYWEACARSDRIIGVCPDLSTLAREANPGEDRRISLRRIVIHMIEETARHAAHADILCEQIDGATNL
jgi:uncharacterized damage-inducible protein DinB